MRSRGYAFQVELTYRALVRGFRVVEVPIVFRDRELGTSKMSWRITAGGRVCSSRSCAAAPRISDIRPRRLKRAPSSGRTDTG